MGRASVVPTLCIGTYIGTPLFRRDAHLESDSRYNASGTRFQMRMCASSKNVTMCDVANTSPVSARRIAGPLLQIGA